MTTRSASITPAPLAESIALVLAILVALASLTPHVAPAQTRDVETASAPTTDVKDDLAKIITEMMLHD